MYGNVSGNMSAGDRVYVRTGQSYVAGTLVEPYTARGAWADEWVVKTDDGQMMAVMPRDFIVHA